MAHLGEEILGSLLGTGQFLSKRWKHPGAEYPATPILMSNAAQSSEIVGVGGPAESVTDEEMAKLQYEFYQLQQGDGAPVSTSHHESALAVAKEFHDTMKSNFLGYQANVENSYSHLAHYMDNHVNNIGDPFSTGSFLNQSKFMERAVLDYFAALWKAEWPHDRYREKAAENNTVAKPQKPNSYWGFVLSMGCTEGTLYGLWNGRDYLAGKVMLVDQNASQKGKATKISTRPTPRYVMARCEDDPQYPTKRGEPDRNANRLTPICFFSEDSHYSLQKAMVILNIRTYHEEAINKFIDECPLGGPWPEKVPSNEDGSVNVEALVKLVEFFAEKGYPPLICFNFGTTFKGSYDDIETASHLLIPILDKYGLKERCLEVEDGGKTIKVRRNGFWFHVDGALGAAYIPFLRMAQAFSMYPDDKKVPQFDFSLRGPKPKSGSADKDYSDVEVVQSIGMSGHKWIGAPFPTGVYMTKSKFQLMPPEIPTYVGTPDTTFAGSRNGLASVVLWDHLARRSFHQQMEKAVSTQNMADYLVGGLNRLEALVQEEKLHASLTPKSLFIQRATLSLGVIFRRPNPEIVAKYCLSKETENGLLLVHAYAMEHVTRDLVDKFILDLSEDGAFEQPGSD